jgi:aspartate kinase
VATAGQLRKVAAIVESDPTRRLVVPSAPGKAHADDIKVTDLLYLAHDLANKGQDFSQVWGGIVDRFTGIIDELGLDLDLQPHLEAARQAIADGADAAFAASRGEALHGRVVAALLGADYVDAAEVIRFRDGGRLDQSTADLIRTRCTGDRRIVIPGFYGADATGRVRTFSRGGSDVTGAIIASALGARCYENWTDVPGVLMTDPRIVPEARPIREITYRELRELSYMGASVLHEEAVFPVRDEGIPINIRSTNQPDEPGTAIVAERDAGDQLVTGIAGRAGFSVILIEKALMNAEIGFGRRVLDVFERLGISYEHTPSGIDTLSVVVSDSQVGEGMEQVVEDLEAAVRPDRIEVFGGMALIATVGQGMNRRIGTAARLFGSLADNDVNIRMIDQGSSEQNIIVGVEEQDLPVAIRTIYDAFCD